MYGRVWITLGSLLAAVAVSAGAVGTHYLKETLKLSPSDLETYEVAVRYQTFHAIALVLLGLLLGRARSRWLTAAGIAFLLGIMFFSAGLYAWLATGVKPFVHVVPVGGMALIVAWLMMAIGAWTSTSRGE